MTDYAKPTTPGTALRDAARTLHWYSEDHERKAHDHKLLAAAFRERAHELDADADLYDKDQPGADR